MKTFAKWKPRPSPSPVPLLDPLELQEHAHGAGLEGGPVELQLALRAGVVRPPGRQVAPQGLRQSLSLRHSASRHG